MRILIIGSNGLLGSDLVEDWTGDHLIPATSRDADIRELEQVRQLVTREHPDWIISWRTCSSSRISASREVAGMRWSPVQSSTRSLPSKPLDPMIDRKSVV